MSIACSSGFSLNPCWYFTLLSVLPVCRASLHFLSQHIGALFLKGRTFPVLVKNYLKTIFKDLSPPINIGLLLKCQPAMQANPCVVFFLSIEWFGLWVSDYKNIWINLLIILYVFCQFTAPWDCTGLQRSLCVCVHVLYVYRYMENKFTYTSICISHMWHCPQTSKFPHLHLLYQPYSSIAGISLSKNQGSSLIISMCF